jgi:hypothetical protein
LKVKNPTVGRVADVVNTHHSVKLTDAVRDEHFAGHPRRNQLWHRG